MKKTLAIITAIATMVTVLAGCSAISALSESGSGEIHTEATVQAASEEVKETEEQEGAADKTGAPEEYVTVQLSNSSATIDGEPVAEYDYTWNVDPAGNYEEVKNAPAEYYTGSKPENEDIYIAHDIKYFPEIDEDKFTVKNYDGEKEWVTYYQSEENSKYLFGTLPVRGDSVPAQMMHSADEAFDNPVLHINKAGTYKLTGEWDGQINIDLGEDAFTNPESVVKLILDSVSVSCDVAPGIIFQSVYECDNEWEDRDEYDSETDTKDAGANVIIADGSTNSIYGTNIYRMLKTKYKEDDPTGEVPVQKKIRKNDGALYSYMSMNIDGGALGTGILNVTSENEGIDSELHLTINGGNINIYSQDDGINTNEDGVSVTTINGGDIRIVAGLGDEGDGVDSNGYIVINGGKLVTLASPAMDTGLDSDCGSFVYGGEVLALGSSMDWVEEGELSGDSDTITMNLSFAGKQDKDCTIEIKDESGKTVFSYSQKDDERLLDNARSFSGAVVSSPLFEKGKSYTLWIDGVQQSYTGTSVGGFGNGGMQAPPDGFGPGENFEMPEGIEMPEGFEMPEGLEMPEFDKPDGTPPDGLGKQDGGKKPDMNNTDRPQPPSGAKGEGGRPGDGMPGGSSEEGEASDTFKLENNVNSFSGIRNKE